MLLLSTVLVSQNVLHIRLGRTAPRIPTAEGKIKLDGGDSQSTLPLKRCEGHYSYISCLVKVRALLFKNAKAADATG